MIVRRVVGALEKTYLNLAQAYEAEFGDVAEGTVCINQGYQLDSVVINGQTLAQGSFYQDEFPDVVVDRQTLSDQQDPENEN